MVGIKNQKGMTLVELVVAMGIASTMLLAISDIVGLTMRAQRGAQANQEFDLTIQNLKVVISREAACQTIFSQGEYTWTRGASGAAGTLTHTITGETNNFAASANRLWRVRFPGGNYILDARASPVAQPYTGITFDPIRVTPVASPMPVQLSYPDPRVVGSPVPLTGTYEINLVRLDFTAQKRRVGNQVAVGGQQLTSAQGITIALVTGPVTGSYTTPNRIVSCYADQSGPEAACASLGGVWRTTVPAGQTQCMIPTANFFGSNGGELSAAGQADGTNNMAGARIRLWGRSTDSGGTGVTWGQNDYSIGVDANQLWFTMGGDGMGIMNQNGATTIPNQFVWNSRPDTLNTGSAIGDRGNQLLALGADATLQISPQDSGNATLGFGANISAAPTATTGLIAPREYIQSQRNAGLGNFHRTLTFWTGTSTNGAATQPRLTLWQGGRVQVGKSDYVDAGSRSYGEVIFADGAAGAATAAVSSSPGPKIRAYLGVPNTDVPYFNRLELYAGQAAAGSPQLALSGAFGANPARVDMAANLIVNGTATVNGALTATGNTTLGGDLTVNGGNATFAALSAVNNGLGAGSPSRVMADDNGRLYKILDLSNCTTFPNLGADVDTSGLGGWRSSTATCGLGYPMAVGGSCEAVWPDNSTIVGSGWGGTGVAVSKTEFTANSFTCRMNGYGVCIGCTGFRVRATVSCCRFQ